MTQYFNFRAQKTHFSVCDEKSDVMLILSDSNKWCGRNFKDNCIHKFYVWNYTRANIESINRM